MKELSIEEKAHRYDEAIEVARKIKNGEPINVPDGTLIPDAIFPELAEGKGERIKNLIYCLIRDRSDNGKLLEHNGISVEEALAWLEKQGEQSKRDVQGDYKETLFKIATILSNNEDKEGSPLEEIRDIMIDGACCAMDFEKKEPKKISQEYPLTPDECIKPAWSEEDNYTFERLFCRLHNEQDNYPQLSCDFQEIQGIEEWLESLKDRVQAQNTWKPNDEQMEALSYYIKNCVDSDGVFGRQLIKLYHDLKKLKEE